MVYDVFGKLIANHTFENRPNHVLDLSYLGAGVYIIRIENNSEIVTKKVTIF